MHLLSPYAITTRVLSFPSLVTKIISETEAILGNASPLKPNVCIENKIIPHLDLTVA